MSTDAGPPDPAENPPPLQYTEGCSPAALPNYWLTPSRLTATIREWLLRGFAGEIVARSNGAGGQEDFTYNIMQDELRHLVWQDSSLTDISIMLKHQFNPAETGKRPQLLVHRNRFQRYGLFIGDKNLLSADLQGRQFYDYLLVGSHTVFVLSRVHSQVELLADEIRLMLQHHGKLAVQSWSSLHRWSFIEQGDTFKLEESQETFATPLTFGWEIQEAFELVPQSPFLRGVTIELGPRLGRMLDV